MPATQSSQKFTRIIRRPTWVMRQARSLDLELLLSLERRVQALEDRLRFACPRLPPERSRHLHERLDHCHVVMLEFFTRIGAATDALSDLRRGLDEALTQAGSRKSLLWEVGFQLQVLRIQIRNLSADLGNASERLHHCRVLVREHYQTAHEASSEDMEQRITEKLQRLLEHERRTRVCLQAIETELRTVRLQLGSPRS